MILYSQKLQCTVNICSHLVIQLGMLSTEEKRSSASEMKFLRSVKVCRTEYRIGNERIEYPANNTACINQDGKII